MLTVALTLIAQTLAFADIAPAPGKSPNRVKKPTAVNTEMEIRLDPNATEAKLIIPASQLKRLRAELDELGGDDNTASGSGGEINRTQTIISGVFLSVAFVFGGLWISRNRKVLINNKAIGILAIAGAIGSAATLVYANAGPPAEARSITSKMFSQAVHFYGFGYGKIKLQTGDGERVKLVVPNPKTEAKPAAEE